ncbi:HTH domain-containing protein [Microbispora bryophytorum]|uniref:HTH domain-containing protein n=1 Tax=Microbispora bryophytorum TaxID=1460882 RepID=UPI00340EED80
MDSFIPQPYGARKIDPNGKAIVPYDLITSGVSPQSLMLWLTLDTLREGNQWVTVPEDDLAKYLKVTIRSVQRYIAELRDAGWLEISKDMRTMTNCYKLIGTYEQGRKAA